MRRTRAKRPERGAVTVEFVMILPFFLFLIFTIISLSVMFSFRQTMSQAATEGARAAAVAPPNKDKTAEARTAVDEAFQGQVGGTVNCTTGWLTCDIVTVKQNPAASCGVANPCRISVTLTYPYRAHPRVAMPLLGLTLPTSIVYSASARVS